MASLKLPLPTDELMRLTGTALSGLRHIYKPGYRYVKAGIMFAEIQPDTVRQSSLFDTYAAVHAPSAQNAARS